MFRQIRAHLPPIRAADRAFRSNLFACGKKYFRCNRLRGSKSASMRILNREFCKAKLHAWLPAAIHGGVSKPHSGLDREFGSAKLHTWLAAAIHSGLDTEFCTAKLPPQKRQSRFFGGICALALAACATTNEAYRPIDNAAAAQDFSQAVRTLNASRARVYPKKNAVLLHLDRGMLEHYAGDYTASQNDLQDAENLIEKYYAKSITQAAASYIANDNTKDYAGEDYENIYLNIFNALNYYHNGDVSGALVEIRRVNEKLSQLEEKYAKALEKARRADAEHSGAIKGGGAGHFTNSALARYLGALFYRGEGLADDARIDFAEIQKAFRLAPEIYPFPLPAALVPSGAAGYETGEELRIPAGMARLNILAFTGLSPYKEEESLLIPLPLPAPNHFARIALPRLVNRPSIVSRVSVSVDGGTPFNLDLLEDTGLVAAETFKTSRSLTIAKSTVRSILKQTAGAGLSHIAREQGGGSMGLLVGILTTAFNTASEQADIRVSRYLPRYAFAGGVNLAPGEHKVLITFAPGVTREQTITVRAEAVNLIEAFYLK
jgi:hypothetical protein